MGKTAGIRAVVLGGSMAGLLAARVLSESYAEVLLVDRDRLADSSGPRRGVPQGRHAHGLVARGQQILEQQFPGLTEELKTAGVEPGDFGGDIRWYFNGRRMAPGPTGLIALPATRPVLEQHVRRRVKALPNVAFLEEHDILGLDTTADRTRVTGVLVQARETGSAPRTLEADLVVDTTGRGSRTPVWLEELGYARPEEERVEIDLAYTTRHYRLDTDPLGDDQAIIPAATPEHPRGGFFYRLPGEGNRFELSLTGILGDHPPTDPEGFLAFVRSLPIPDIHDAIVDAEPLDDPVMHRYPASVWRHYERLQSFPGGFLVMGDAVCSFNPIYAQGMTVAALESLELRRHLERGSAPSAAVFFKDIAAKIKAPWELAAGSDLGYAGVAGKRSPMLRMINAYVARLQAAAVYDPALSEAFIRVAGLIDPPPALLRPRTVLRVLRVSRAMRSGKAVVPLPPVRTRTPDRATAAHH
ncbi:FAD-dependent oxidoreductase [Streptomyces antarcticus]|uniref:FAD-dependent oxidoreductase n=1 Tax=Streptomyces antarcticus TaxID=2996458 RepID=UPI002271E407|nr:MULTISPECIES: FAD-dependent monooxygenase [unclassified Streptomyces]MCY0942917.1 FAD-binding monooxygenase [Streptomyces sp. H34-AA3]MCY0953036.1 FAD-binding monooxygenase [Streptomyces sp. H27-S2]MCZ4083123.1 FAD-binding monooxygenase [Streptomyces sp. H34-S5]